MKIFATLTAASALLLDLASLGDDLTFLNSHSLENSVNSRQPYCRQLSVTSTSGMPWRLNCSLRNSVKYLAVVPFTSPTSVKSD